MSISIKTAMLLIVCLLCLSAFRQEISASIIGQWTQTEAIHVVMRPGSSIRDSTVSHDRGFAVSFTPDSQYHFTAPYGHKADGFYSVSGDTLHEESPATHTSADLEILLLTDHALITRSQGRESGRATEMTTTYSR